MLQENEARPLNTLDAAAARQVAPLLALATESLRAGRPADAIAPLRDAAHLEPANAFIQRDLGLAYLETGRISGIHPRTFHARFAPGAAKTICH